MAADDFSVAIPARQSIWEAVAVTYNGGNGRFVATLIQSIFVLMTGDDGKTVFYSLITFGLLLSALVVFFKKLLRTGFKSFYTYLLASASFALLYLLTPNKSETWYWLTGSATYLWSITLFLFSASFLFEDRPGRARYLAASFFSFASVACNETFGLLVVAALSAKLLFSWKFDQKKYLTLSMLVASLASFAIMYFAPGNSIRAEGAGSNPMSFGGSALYSIQEGPKHLFSMVRSSLHLILSLFIAFSYIFYKLAGSFREKAGREVLVSRIFMALVVPVALSILYMLPAFKILGRIQPDRSDISLAFVVLMSTVAAAYYLSRHPDFGNFLKLVGYDLILFSAAAVLLISSFTFTSSLAGDVYIAKNYSRAYDEMIGTFKSAAGSRDKGDIAVSLPYSGLIPVTLDPPGHTYYKNQTLSLFYGVGRIVSK